MWRIWEDQSAFHLPGRKEALLSCRLFLHCHINLGAWEPGLLLVAFVCSQRSASRHLAINDCMSLSIAGCTSSGVSPFAEYYCQEHVHSPDFTGLKKRGRMLGTLPAKVFSLLLHLERWLFIRNIPDIGFSRQAFAPRIRGWWKHWLCLPGLESAAWHFCLCNAT